MLRSLGDFTEQFDVVQKRQSDWSYDVRLTTDELELTILEEWRDCGLLITLRM
jgi:hypothetical protein